MEESKSNPTFTLTGSINYELKFGDKGIELAWNDKTNPARLVSLLISHEVAKGAKANFQENYESIKNNKHLLDRFSWTSKTVMGLDIFVGSFIDVVIEENTLPIITNPGETKQEDVWINKTIHDGQAKTESDGNDTITLQ